MEQLSSGTGSDVGDCVVPSSSSEDQSLVRSSSADATISFQEGHKCSQCHTLQQKLDSLKKQDGVYQTLKQKIVKTDTLIKKYVSKRQECEELQKKNEDLAHKYSLLMKNYKALENQLGNTVKELLPWKLDKDRYVGEVTELRNKLEETEINLSASEVLCKQLKEMIVSNEAQEESYKCKISTLKGDIQEAVQKYKFESLKLKKAKKRSMTLRRKAAEKGQSEGRLRRVLRKMQKIMLENGLVPPEIPENICDEDGIVEGDDSDVELMDESEDEEPTARVAEVRSEQEAEKSVPSENVMNIHDHGDIQSVKKMFEKGLVPPEIPENICDQDGIVEGGNSDVELMDESEDEEPTARVAEVRSEQEAEKSVPSENVMNIHDHGDNQSVSGESDCIVEEAFSDFADEIDAQLGNDETSDMRTPVKVESVERKPVQEEKSTENAPENAPSTESVENVKNTMKQSSSPGKTGLSPTGKEGSITVLGKNSQRSYSCIFGDEGKNVKSLMTEKENEMATDTFPIWIHLGESENLSDGEEDKEGEKELVQQGGKVAVKVDGKDGVRGRRQRLKRKDKGKKKEEGECSDEDGEVTARQEESSSKSSHKSVLYRRMDVISSSLSDSSSDEEIEELKEREREDGKANRMEGRNKDEAEKMRVGEDSIFEEEINQRKRDDTMNNDSIDESTENKKLGATKERRCSQGEEKLEDDLKKDEREVEQNLEKELNLEDKLQDKGNFNISNEVEVDTKNEQSEQFENCSSLGKTGENITKNIPVHEKRDIAEKGNKDRGQHNSESDVILLQSPRRVTRGMLKSLQDTKALRDTNGNHLKQESGDEETKPRDGGSGSAISSRMKNLKDGMTELGERNDSSKGDMESQHEGEDSNKKLLSVEVVKEEGNLEASLFDIEDVKMDAEMNDMSEKKVQENKNRVGEGVRTIGDEKEVVSGSNGDSSVTVENVGVLNKKQDEIEAEISEEKHLTGFAKSSGDIDRLESDDHSELDGRGSDSGLRMTRSKMKSVHVKEEFSGKRVTRLKAKMIPEVAEYLEVGKGNLSGKIMKQPGTRRSNSKTKNTSKSVEFLNTSESENDEVERKRKVEASPRKNLNERMNGSKEDTETVSSVVVKEEEKKSLVGKRVKDEEGGISSVENLSGNGEQSGSKRVKPKRNVSFLEEKKNIESEEVSVLGVFVKKEVVSYEDAKSDSKKDVDGKTQSADGESVKRKIVKGRKPGVEVIHDIKTEPDDKHINLPKTGDALGGKRKKTKGMKSKRKRSGTKDEVSKTSSCRRVAFESDDVSGEEKRKKSAAVSSKSPNVNSGHSKKSESSKVGTFKEVIQEAERYRSGSELSDSLSSPKSAGFSPSRETPFGFEKPKVVLQSSKKLSNQGKPDRDMRLTDEKVEDVGNDEMSTGEVTVLRIKENQRSSNNGVLCKSLLQEGKGSSQKCEGEPSHSQRHFRTIRGDVDHINQSVEAKDRSGNFPSELPFENLMNLDRVSPIPVSPHEVIEEPSLEPMIASILDSLPLITRMLSPIPGSPSRDNEVGNRDDDDEEQEQQQILSPLSPSDPVSFLPPFSSTDTSRPLSPLPLTPVPGEDNPEVVFDEPCGQKSVERGESSVSLPMNFHAVAPAGVIAVRPQVGTSFNSVTSFTQSNTYDTSQILVPGPDNVAEMKEKDIESSASQGKHKFVSKKNGEKSKCGLKKTQNVSPSANLKDSKKEVLSTKEECGQTKMREGGTMEEQVVEGEALNGSGTGDSKSENLLQMNEEQSTLDDKSKESNEDRVVQEMETSSHLNDNQLRQLKAGEKASLRPGSDVDSMETEVESRDDEVDSNIKKKESMGGEKEKISDKSRDGEIAGKIEEKMFVDASEEGMRSVEGKNVSPTPVPEVGCKDDALSSSSMSGEERWERLQSSNSKQGISKDIDQKEKKGNKRKDMLGKSNISDEQEYKYTKEGIEAEKGSSSELKREGSLGFTCTKDTGESESHSGASLKSLSSGKTEVKLEGLKKQKKFGGFASPKTDARKEISKVKGNTASEQEGKGDRTKDKASTTSGSSDHETDGDDSTDFVDYNINTRERPKVDSSIAPASKMKVAQIWGNIAEKSLAEDQEDVICKRKNWREHSKLKKQKIGTGSRLMSDSETVSNQDIALDELIQEVNETVEETEHTVVQRIIQYLKKNSLDLLATVISKVQRKDCSLDPVITQDEEKFIEAISQRDKKVAHMDKLVPQLMICLSTLISCEKTKEKDPKDHSKKVTYCRIFAAFCRLKGDAMMLRVLCYDIVKKNVHRWEELLVCISSVWSTALTKMENQSLQPITCVLEFLTWQRLKLPDNKQNLSDALWQALEFLCHWREPSIKEVDKMIQSLTDNMKDCELIKFKGQLTTFSSLEHPSFEIVKAIELLAWTKGWQWTWAVVIQSYIWPAMGGLCKELSLGQTQKASCMCCCLKVLGNLGNVGLKDEQNQSVFDLMKMIAEILAQSNETIPPVVQVYAVQTILNLAPIQPFFANECLQKWTQDHQDIQLHRNEKARMDTLAKFVKSYKKPRSPGNQRSRNQGKQTNYNRMPPPQDFSSPKRGGHQRRPKRPQFGQ